MLSKNDEVSSSKYYNKPIVVRCLINGKSISPYCIPKKVKFSCIQTENNDCKFCIYKSTEENVLEIKPIDSTILKFIDINDSYFEKLLKEIFYIPCRIKYEVIEVQNIERVFILPPLKKDRGKSGITQLSYFVGYGIDINKVYEMQGYTTVDPKNQTTTHVFTNAIKVRSDIESFSMSIDKHNQLTEAFYINEPDANKIFEYLYSLYDHYAHNITKIYNRFDLHLAVDLVTKSVLSFYFDNEFVHRGWMDAMILGDTRCGKGYVAEKMQTYFDIGEVVSGENVSFAGLVGGLQQLNKHWIITWGKIPMNDGGLVTIDEASEISPQDWSKLSRIRSEGLAEITKIQTQITNARTRLLFLTNPINKTIANYSYGIQALMDVIKAPEDIARFDYVLVVAHNEVPVHEINVRHSSTVKKVHSSQLEHDLIMWIWSRKSNEIKFSQDAIEKIYKLSIELSKQYSFSIPLIQGENIRIKLAKLAVAFAGRTYSNREDGKYLFVDSCHVDCAISFLHLIYKKDASGYFSMSQLRKDLDMTYNEKDFDIINKYFNTFGQNKIELCKCLLNNNTITSVVLSEHLNLPPEIAREILSKLLKNDCVTMKSNQYTKIPSFNNWLKKVILK